MEENRLILPRADGTFLELKEVTVHVNYVNEDGTPATTPEGKSDNGNYAVRVPQHVLAQFPAETIAGLAQIYDAAMAENGKE